MQQGDTIAAIATPPGEGGIGIVRLSGRTALEVAEKVFRAASGRELASYDNYRAVYGHVVTEAGETIDEALALIMRAPHSYTCEDVVELQCHGGPMPLRRTLGLCLAAGARMAESGEFTKRAFLNGRLDLAQAASVMDVISARTNSALRLASGHLAGHFSERIRGLRGRLLEQISHIEATIDFPEDGVEDVVEDELRQTLAAVRQEIAAMLATAHTGRILREGLETAIIGRPNVGKSSLLNALLREERAIVTDIPGTTRDAIAEYADVSGVPLHIIDTAGIRETDDVVERLGVERSRAAAEQAALVLALFDGSSPLTAEDSTIMELAARAGQNVILLLTKADLPAVTTPDDLRRALADTVQMDDAADGASAPAIIRISTAADTGLDELAAAIKDIAYTGAAEGAEDYFVSDERQAAILRAADRELAAAEDTLAQGIGLDFVSIDIRSGWESLGELIGETIGDDIIDDIFSRFCIGK